MSSKITHDLVKKAQKGDADAFGELYALYMKDMFRFAFYYTGNESLAEDCVSETALIAFQKITQLKKAASFKSWLFKILYNSCNAARKEKVAAKGIVRLEDAENLTYENKDSNELISLKNALKCLSAEEREVIILHYSCGYTSKEIGEITGLNHSTVRSKISRGTEKLRTLLSI